MTADLEAVTRDKLARWLLDFRYEGRVGWEELGDETHELLRGRADQVAAVFASLPDDRLACGADGVTETHVLTEELDQLRSSADRLAEAEAKVRREVDERWNRAVDWLLNHGATFGLQELFWGHVDGLITAKELRDESVSDATIARRRKRQERADAKVRAALSGGDAT